MGLERILQSDVEFRYQLLDRMRSDCEYFLGYGNRCSKFLWAKNVVEHIAIMKAIWKSFDKKGKPQWLKYGEILEYEKAMVE